MEQPYKGRAIIQDNLTDMHIIIPTKKNWFIIIFLGAWLGGWLMGEMVVSRMLITQLADNPAGLFVLFWLIAWTAGGFFAIRTFLWMVKGKEIITVGQNILKIDRKGSLFFKSKLYNLDQVKYIRVQDDFSNMFWRRNDFSAFNSAGLIRFDYGLKTIKFAQGIDEAEARFILDKLKERRILTEKNHS